MPEIGLLQGRMAEEGFAAAILTSYETVSPFARTNIITQPWVPDRMVFFVVPASGPTTLLVCAIEEQEVRATTIADDLRTYVEFAEEPTTVLAQLMKDLRLDEGRVGFELRRLPGPHVQALQAAMPSLRMGGADDIIHTAVGLKTADEIASLGDKARATQAALDRGLAAIPAGATERECSQAFMRELVQTGGRPEFMVFGSAEQTMLGHPITGDVPLREGALWRIDFGARFPDGYVSDFARTGVVGAPTPQQEEAIGHLVDCQCAAIDAIEPGRPANEVWKAATSVLERAGLSIWAPHIGHSLGVGLHERPSIDPANTTPLATGMVLNIEPIFVLPEHREGYHTEDLVVVTETGVERLTKPQTELLRIAA
jgi:Xaa-Pro dipeptidase